MRRIPHLQCINSIFYYHQRVPVDLLPHFGRPFIKRSLKTKNIKEAKRALKGWQSEAEKTFTLLRSGLFGEEQTQAILGKFLGDQNHPQATQYSQTPSSPPTTPHPLQQPHGGKKLSEIIGLRLREIQNEKSPNTVRDCKSIYQFILRLLGDRDIKIYRREDIIEAKEKLKRFPVKANYISDLRKKPIEEILSMEGLGSPLSEGTVHKYLIHINILFKYSVDNGFLERSPCPPVKKSRELKRKDKRLPFSPADINRLISSPFYVDSRVRLESPHNFWIPLIALFSGMRQKEICQLYVDDIKNEQGIWYFDINDQGDKDLKNANAERTVPIHPFLVDIGFLEYVGDMKKQSEKRLWEQLPKAINGYNRNYSRNFSTYLRRHISKDPRKVFHSFRNTLAAGLTKAEVRQEVIAHILGHETEHPITESYTGKTPLETKLIALKQINYAISREQLCCYGQFRT